MARIIAVLVAALLALAIAGYLFYSGKEYSIRIPEAEIQQNLEKGLPITRQYLAIFELTLDNPRVDLRPDSGRIAAGLDLSLKIMAVDDSRTFSGTVDISGLPQYVAGKGEFYLEDLKIDLLALPDLPERQLERLRLVIEAALSEYYSRHPIYTLKRGKLRQLAARLALKEVSVDGDDLVLTLGKH
ncbi:DUF1439 domain-containing protein [Microbulbifer magnicolonia]|uniref:DUF1439 domain-containing protein n=1 Tax=Microbulbifer magnicolonia TaxID=3109744 RepID=UPI002B41843F|nr:DUF1439 domain-containing protein [Microbulbifer sp. GG15]